MKRAVTLLLALILLFTTCAASAENLAESLAGNVNRDANPESMVYKSLYRVLQKANGENLPLESWQDAMTYLAKAEIGEPLDEDETVFDESISAYEKLFLLAMQSSTLSEEQVDDLTVLFDGAYQAFPSSGQDLYIASEGTAFIPDLMGQAFSYIGWTSEPEEIDGAIVLPAIKNRQGETVLSGMEALTTLPSAIIMKHVSASGRTESALALARALNANIDWAQKLGFSDAFGFEETEAIEDQDQAHVIDADAWLNLLFACDAFDVATHGNAQAELAHLREALAAVADTEVSIRVALDGSLLLHSDNVEASLETVKADVSENAETVNVTAVPEPTMSPTNTVSPTQKASVTPTAKTLMTPAPTKGAQPTATAVNGNATTAPVITAKPTALPVFTAKPTVAPTATIKPTALPVFTARPTATPTVAPTATPKPADSYDLPYVIYVSKNSYTIAILSRDSNGEYTKVARKFSTGIGKAGQTRAGTYTISTKERWHSWGTRYSPYASKHSGGLYIHGPIYEKKDSNSMLPGSYNQIGTSCSAGCLRTTCSAAAWVFYNCPVGTRIIIANDSKYSASRPSSISSTQKYDPTDPGASPEIPITSFTLSTSSVSLNPGQTATVSVTSVRPEDNSTGKDFKYSSDNTSIATVSSSGVITAVAAGTTTVTVMANDVNGVTRKVSVTVTDPAAATGTPAPTSAPTVTAAPTSQPDSPTQTPTDAPTNEPTNEPVETPITEPTAEPAENPTEEPDTEPTETPSAEPGDEPTEANPTDAPAETPTPEPVVTPEPIVTQEPVVTPEPAETEKPDQNDEPEQQETNESEETSNDETNDD